MPQSQHRGISSAACQLNVRNTNNFLDPFKGACVGTRSLNPAAKPLVSPRGSNEVMVYAEQILDYPLYSPRFLTLALGGALWSVVFGEKLKVGYGRRYRSKERRGW